MNSEKTKFKNTAFYSNIISIILSSIGLPLVVVLYFVLKNADFTYIQSIGFNWKSYPINSLSTMDLKNPVCKNDNTQIIFDFWFGTSSGCDCTNSLFVVGSALTRGFCTRRQPGPGCVDILRNNPSPYIFWRNNMFCKNKSQMTYLDINIVQDPNACGEKFKNCGVIDSQRNYLCLPEDENCPINKMEFIGNENLLEAQKTNTNTITKTNTITIKNNTNNNTNTNNTNTNNTNTNNTNTDNTNNINTNNTNTDNTTTDKTNTEKKNTDNIIDYDGNYLLKDFVGYLKIEGGVWAFSNKFTDSKVINQFKISEGKPCLSTYFHNSYKSKFLLDNTYFMNTCWKNKIDKSIIYDERYFLVDSYWKNKLFDENKITEKFSYFLNKTYISNKHPDFGEGVFQYPEFYQRTLQENPNNNSISEGNSTIDKYYANYLYSHDFNYNYTIDLYARNYIGLKVKCFNDIKRNNMKDELFAYLKNAPINLAIGSDLMYYVFLATFGLQVYNFVVYGTFYCIKKFVDQKDATIYFDMFKWKLFVSLFPLLLISFLIICYVYTIGLIKTPNSILSILNDKNCLDFETFEQLDDFFNRQKNAFTLILISLSNLIIQLLNILGFFSLKLFKVINDE